MPVSSTTMGDREDERKTDGDERRARDGMLRQLYLDAIANQHLREANAKIAAAQTVAIERGLAAGDAGWASLRRIVTMNWWRDKKGSNLLSPELEFVSKASAFYGATDLEIAETLEPAIKTGTIGEIDRALDSVQKQRKTLHLRRVVVSYDCRSKTCPRCIEDRAHQAG